MGASVRAGRILKRLPRLNLLFIKLGVRSDRPDLLGRGYAAQIVI